MQLDNPLKSALAMIKIDIVDVNEFAPRFDESVYTAKVSENAEPGAFVCQVSATDADRNRIEYSIVNNHEAPFLIGRHDGIIKVNGRLDYETKSQFTIQVRADDGNFTATAAVRISLSNKIDQAPNFEYSNYLFKLKTPHDIYIGQVRALDVEQTGMLKYSIKSNEKSLFCISQNGIIFVCPTTNKSETVKSKLKMPFYQFNVTASIYSKDLSTVLESRVACKIEIELDDKEYLEFLLSNQTGVVAASNTFLDEQYFKDPTLVYIFIGVIVGSIVLLLGCASASVWFKCHKSSKQAKAYSDKGFKFFPTFGLFDSAAIDADKRHECSSCSCSSSRTSDSCKNSTSGISCLSEASVKYASRDQRLLDRLEYLSSRPSDYFSSHEAKHMKSSKLVGDLEQIKVCQYGIKSQDLPILVRQTSPYAVDEYEHAFVNNACMSNLKGDCLHKKG